MVRFRTYKKDFYLGSNQRIIEAIESHENSPWICGSFMIFQNNMNLWIIKITIEKCKVKTFR